MKHFPAIVLLVLFLSSLSGTYAPALSGANLQHSVRGNLINDILSITAKSVNQSSNVLVSDCGSVRNSEVESATDPTNGYVYELWIGCNGIGFARSIDGGEIFSQPLVIPGSLDGRAGNSSWDPAITVSNSGIVYASYMRSTQNQGGVPYVAISNDHGATFEAGSNVSTPSATEFGDRDFIAVSLNNTIYVTWNYAPNASLVRLLCPQGGSCYYTSGDLNIVISHSSDGGKTWSKIVPISPDYPNGGGVSAPLLVEPSGRIDVLYEDYSIGANHELGQGLNYFTYSNDGGNTWAKRVAIGNSSGYLSNTEWWIDGDLARDNFGTLYASFDTSNGTSENAWLVSSTSDGLTWSTPIELSRGDNSTLNIMPGVLGAGNSSVYTAWMADYPRGWSAYFQVFSNAGAALSKQIVVSNMSGANGIWGGDTLGLASLDDGVAVSWGYAVQNLSEIYSSNVYNVTLGTLGPGSVNPNGSNWFRPGSEVSLGATPDSTSTFAGWTGSSQSLVITNSSSPNTSLIVYGGGLITAKFAQVITTSSARLSTTSTALENVSSYWSYISIAIIGVVIIAVSFAVVKRRRRLEEPRNPKISSAASSSQLQSAPSLIERPRHALTY